MKTYIHVVFVCFFSLLFSEAGALPLNPPPPPNDLQCDAEDLGLLDFVPCAAGDSITVSGTTQGADYASALTLSSSCFPYTSPDVWYKFTTRSTIVRVNLVATSIGFDSMFVRIFDEQNNCINLIPLDCSTTLTGAMSVDFYTPTFNGVYYLEIGGYGWIYGDFDLTLSGVELCNECTVDMSIELNTPPVNGHYYPGDVVEMCLTIDRYSTQGVSSLHSIIPSLVGLEWVPNSIVPIDMPDSPNNPNGWIWTTAATPLGNKLGFFYDGDSNGDPNDNLGDAAFVLQSWEACWEGVVNTNFVGGDLLTKVYVFNDGQTGSASTTSCGPDPVLKIDLGAYNCQPPLLFVNGPLGCNDTTTIGVYYYESLQDTADYYLYNENNEVVDSALNINSQSFVFFITNPGTYTLSAYNHVSGCYTTASVKVPFAIQTNVNQI
ncbi:MAG: hypothetical protein ACRCYO_07830, partial [Bacteroidia bacterium]